MPRRYYHLGGFALVASLVFVLWFSLSRPREPISGQSVAGAQKIGISTNKAGDIQPAATPSPSSALVEVEGRSQVLGANVRGEFPRFPVPAGTVIKAKVPFPDALPGELIAVQAEDGGLLLGEGEKGSLTLDEQKLANVDFKVSAFDGIHRVSLRRGAETRQLEFWVGTEQPVLVRR